MANKISNIRHPELSNDGLKQKNIGSMQFYYDEYSVGVKIGIQFFRISPSIGNNPLRKSVKTLIETIESGEITDVNEMYGVVRTGYQMSPTTKLAFEMSAKDKRQAARLEPTE